MRASINFCVLFRVEQEMAGKRKRLVSSEEYEIVLCLLLKRSRNILQEREGANEKTFANDVVG